MHLSQLLSIFFFSVTVAALPIEPTSRTQTQPDYSTSALFPEEHPSKPFSPQDVVIDEGPASGRWEFAHRIQSSKAYGLVDEIVHLGRSTTLQSFRALDHAYGLLNCHKLADGSKANHGEPCSVQYTQ